MQHLGHRFGYTGESSTYSLVLTHDRSEVSTYTFTENGGYYEKAH